MAKAIMVQGTMSMQEKAFWQQGFAGFLNRMDTGWHPLNPRIWH